MGDLDDLDILPAPPVRITIGGRQLEIDALRMRQWRPMSEALDGAWPDILSGRADKMLDREEQMYKAIIIGTDGAVDEDWLRNLYPSQAMRLFRVLVDHNADFFGRAVVQEMTRLMAAFVPAAPAPSPASSPGSPSADTDTTTS